MCGGDPAPGFLQPAQWEPLTLTAVLSPAENLSFWEACEELRFGGQAQVPALVDSVYQ